MTRIDRPSDHGAGAGALSVQPVHRDRRRAGAAVSPASSRSSGTATSPACREALEAVQDTLPTWRGQNEQSMALAAIGFAKAKRRRQIMVAASSIGPGATEHGDRRRRRPCEPAAGAAPLRRHLRQPPARSGDAAGRALREPDHHRERRLQGGHAATGTGSLYPEQIIVVAAAGGGGDARPGRLRAGLPVALPGHAGDRLRLSRGLLRADRLVDPAPAPRSRPAGRGGGAPQGGEEAADHLRRRRALLAGRGDAWRSSRSTAASRSPRPSPARARSPTTTRRMPARSASSARPRPTRWRRRRTWSWRSARGSWTSPPGPGRVFNHDARIIGINAARWDATKHRALAVVGDALRDGGRARRRPRRLEGAGRPGPRTRAS